MLCRIVKNFGLACCLCSENVACKGCRQDGFKDLSWCKDAEWCENRKCVIAKKLNGCYECEPAECRKGLYAEKIKARAFAEFANRYGVEELLDCLERNEKAGIVYHREGIMGGINKGHPNQKEIQGAVNFFEEISK